MAPHVEEITFPAGGRSVPGTFVTPAGQGHPAVLLLAGSGPTDRDWRSPLLPGTNGSAAQLALALAERGIASLRFDKAHAGKNPGVPLPELTLDTYRDEAVGALDWLAARPEVDPGAVFVAGNSEGGIHATRLAQLVGRRLRGVALLAGPGRSMRDLLIEQLDGNFRHSAKLPADQVEGIMAPIRDGLARFVAGETVDPAALSSIPQVQMIFRALMAPATAGIGRALVSFEPATAAAALELPILVLQGGKDIQVDPERDARHLADQLARAGREVTLHLSPDANHVFKHEPKSVAECRADPVSVQNSYCAGDRPLDPDAVTALAGWVLARAGRI